MARKKNGPPTFRSFGSGVKLRHACIGHYGLAFSIDGMPGIFTFLHEVPNDPTRGVFRDNTGMAGVYLYSKLVRGM